MIPAPPPHPIIFSLRATIQLLNASYLVTECRLGGCGPVVVMRTGPHLGGGPGVDRPRPCRSAAVGSFRPPPAPTGAFCCLSPVRPGSAGHRSWPVGVETVASSQRECCGWLAAGLTTQLNMG